MHPKQARLLSRRPQALMRYQATGRLPQTIEPRSPLISLLETIPPRERLWYRGVRLGPDLGYLCGQQFHNAEQLLNWLRPDACMVEGEPWPAESFRDKRFHRKLTLDDLRRHCAQYPGSEVERQR